MTRFVATRDTVRLAARGLALAAAVFAAPALAGDRALIDYIGYSEDGRYFAFEEFGSQDGSGFAFSTIYIVDLPADKWVTGSPYRVVLEDDEADVSDARDAASEQAEAKLDELGIYGAVSELAHNGDGDPRTGDGHALDFGDPGYGLGEVMDVHSLTLTAAERDAGEDCAIIENDVLGFSLSLDGDTVYSDPQTLPKTRGCAQGYKIYSVVRPAEWSEAQGGTVAIIANYPFGFEGPDRRFLAVPLGQ